MKKINVRPLGNRVIVEPVRVKKTTYGIVLPDNVLEKTQRGVVTSVGPGLFTVEGTLRKMFVSVGDLVIFSRFVGTEIKIEEEIYLVVSEDDIFCVVDKQVGTSGVI